MRPLPRNEIIGVMRRVGMGDQVVEAQQILPEVVDVDRDDHLLYRLGLSLDQLEDRLGGSAW